MVRSNINVLPLFFDFRWKYFFVFPFDMICFALSSKLLCKMRRDGDFGCMFFLDFIFWQNLPQCSKLMRLIFCTIRMRKETNQLLITSVNQMEYFRISTEKNPRISTSNRHRFQVHKVGKNYLWIHRIGPGSSSLFWCIRFLWNLPAHACENT